MAWLLGNLEQWPLDLGLFLLVFCFLLLIVNKHQRYIFDRFYFRYRRSSNASTPPRSVSPTTKEAQSSKRYMKNVICTSTPDYAKTFPPSRRSALTEVAVFASGESRETLLAASPPQSVLETQPLPMAQSYSTIGRIPIYTATGFSTEEIKAMGDFPPYDILSGIPLPSIYVDFNHETALPRPYRPFRWAYHQTMSLTRLEPDWWLEVENTYISRIKERQELFRKYGLMVLDYLPGSELACKELMEMCLQFYCARYPTHFSLSCDKRVFHNRLLKKDTVIKTMHPLHVLLNNVPEDFAIVLRNEKDGQYYFRAGVICSSLGWNVSTKIGLPLEDIHKPIPDYKEKMSFSMDRYFSKMPTNAANQRGSWGLEIGKPLFMPPGDPHEGLRENQAANLKAEDCFLRTDWQTLRRLPLSAGIVFNFKALFTPVTEFRDEPYIPSLLLKILKEGKRSLMEYKNTWHVEHVCIPKLEVYEREQLAQGLVKSRSADETTWTVSTLEESPYFPGWEEKWHRQQGF